MAERDPGPGYRPVAVGEVMLSTDEAWSDWSQSWDALRDAPAVGNRRMNAHKPIRRKKEVIAPDPGPGYRLLDRGETILPGDEFMNTSLAEPKWRATSREGLTYSSTSGNEFYRRKVEPGSVAGPYSLDETKARESIAWPYMEVPVGEVMQENDQVFDPTQGRWRAITPTYQSYNIGVRIRSWNWVTRRRIGKAETNTFNESKEDTSMTHAFGDPEALERQATMLLERAERARNDIDRFGTNEDWEVGNIIIFSKRYSPDPDGQVFTYAALRHAGGWAVTGQGSLTYSTIQKVVQFARESNEIDPGFSRVTEIEEF